MIGCLTTVQTYDDCCFFFPLKRIQTHERLSEAKQFQEDLLLSGSVKHEPVCEYYKVLIILIVEAEVFLEEQIESVDQHKPEEEELASEIEATLDRAVEALDLCEYDSFLGDVATKLSERISATYG